jgi:hypothetical protein
MPEQFRPAQPDFETGLAIRVWNVLGGLDWAGLESAADLFGIVDMDLLIHRLVEIRRWQQEETN